ncbi:NADP-dependent oxidoreductase [Bacillus manliponensis]|uniref:NADP-dependent oxidoreductase n=1 Tax=Bacillus manliponensis TaxID=574376 RepID=UPI0035183265
MKAIVIENYGSTEELKQKQITIPTLHEDEVLIEVYAAAINPVDWKTRQGQLQEVLHFSFPIILGLDAAGIVVKTGKNVTAYKRGDKVYTKLANVGRGAYAEYVTEKEEYVARMPENLTFEQAASVPLAGLTAWQSLVDYGGIQKGDRVFIHAGAGGVGSFAIQIAKAFGAHVTTTASLTNHDFLKELGADIVIDYRKEKFEHVATNDYDIILDTIGGEVQEKSYSLLKPGGRLVSIVHAPKEGKLVRDDISAEFMWLKPSGKQLSQLSQWIEEEKLKPIVSHVLNFSEENVRKAHTLSEQGHTRGKIVINVKYF